MDYQKYDVVLLPTFIQVENWRKAQARDGRGIFGQTVSTFNAWIADLWELFGDGRALVDSVARQMVMRTAFSQIARKRDAEGEAPGEPAGSDNREDGSAASLTLSPGVAPLAARCESLAAGVPAYDEAVTAAGEGQLPAGLSPREGVLLQGIARYRMLLGRLNMVEPGEAGAWLTRRNEEVFPRRLRVLMEDAAPLDWRTSCFFAACPQLELQVHEAFGADGITRAPEGVAPRFAFPAGRYATPALVADLLRQLDAGEQAVITAVDPLALYKQIEPELARRGMSVAVQGLVGFGQTDAGRTILQAMEATNDKVASSSVLADIVASPFSGFTRAQGNDIDIALRIDRIADIPAYVQDLRGRKKEFAQLLDAVGEGDWRPALDGLMELVNALPHRSPAWRGEQLTALSGLRAVRTIAEELGASWRDMFMVLDQMVVSVPHRSALGNAPEKPQVLVTTQGAASQLAAGSCAMLVACDLTADAYPLADKDDAAATLFAKLGLVPADDVLARSRRAFNALMRVPSCEFVCVRPINDVDGNPAYACAMLEEFVDAYRPDTREDGSPIGTDPDKLPAELAKDLVNRGEELLYANARAAAADAAQPVAARPVPPALGDVGATDPEEMLLPRRVSAEADMLHRSPSPSQVETYLECPYKWFVQRRLGIEAPEEGFGPLEKGTFAHAVLERFYRNFAAAGHRKVTAENLATAQQMLREEADLVEAEMAMEKPGSGRLVAANRLDKHEIDQLKEQIVEFLDYERQVLPGFYPLHLEYEFDAEHAVPYAGCAMVGKVDRIDVDGAGHAVVVDYKTSVNPEYDIADKDEQHPGKVQARIYAQMVKRALGLDVVGTVYLSYGRKHALAGAVDSRMLEAPHLPGARKGAVWCAAETHSVEGVPEGGRPEGMPFADYAFPEMLDATENLVARAVERMERGEVAPEPSSPEACRYCPVAQCPKKGA